MVLYYITNICVFCVHTKKGDILISLTNPKIQEPYILYGEDTIQTEKYKWEKR